MRPIKVFRLRKSLQLHSVVKRGAGPSENLANEVGIKRVIWIEFDIHADRLFRPFLAVPIHYLDPLDQLSKSA